MACKFKMNLRWTFEQISSWEANKSWLIVKPEKYETAKGILNIYEFKYN